MLTYRSFSPSVARNSDHERCQTETFKIVRNDKWKLFYNGGEHLFDHLTDLAQFIHTDSMDHIRIPASKYDKPPLLLLCLPKNLKTKKTEAKLSEAELQRRNPQIFNPKTDLQWYKGKLLLLLFLSVICMKFLIFIILFHSQHSFFT